MNSSNLINTLQEGWDRRPLKPFVDSTMRANFVSCPRQFFLSFHLGYTPPSKNINLTAGSAMAKGFEIARKVYFSDGVGSEDAVVDGTVALMKEYISMAGDEFESFSEDAKSLPRCIEAFEKYFTHFGWKSDPIQPAVFNNQPAIEYTFSIPLEITHPETSEPILYTGRYDMIGIYNDQLFIVDEKTCKQLGPTWGNNWRLRSQITGYCWAAHQFEYPVAGAIIRGICFTKEIKFAESIQFRDKWEIERWYEQLNRDIEKMIQCWKDDYWDFNLDTSCTNYGGCQFIDICKAKHAKKWLDSEFTIREWNPLNKD